MPEAAITVQIRSSGCSRTAPPHLEEAFGDRWDARRSVPAAAGPMLHAIGRALLAAGWWRPGSGLAVDAGQVLGTDWHALAPALRFAAGCATRPPRVRVSDFLFALPSSVAAVAGVAFGLERYQATTTQGGVSGFAALAHAAGQLRTGRLQRVVAGAVTRLEADVAARLEPAGGESFDLAVAYCLEAGQAGAMLEATRLQDRDAEQDGGTDTAELLGDLAAPRRALAAPSLLALQRLLRRSRPGDVRTLTHRDPGSGGRASLTIRVGQRLVEKTSAW